MGRKSLACLLALGASLWAGAAARAQSAGGAWVPNPGGGWTLYSPVPSWGGYTVSGSTVTAARPAQVVYTAPATSARGAAGWAGYNPGAAWLAYTNVNAATTVTAWRGYNPPNRPGELYSFHAGERGIYADRVVAIAPSAYRELGTGRQVPLSKPWLEGSPP